MGFKKNLRHPFCSLFMIQESSYKIHCGRIHKIKIYGQHFWTFHNSIFTNSSKGVCRLRTYIYHVLALGSCHDVAYSSDVFWVGTIVMHRFLFIFLFPPLCKSCLSLRNTQVTTRKKWFFSNFSCTFLNPNIFSDLNSNCSDLSDMRNL